MIDDRGDGATVLFGPMAVFTAICGVLAKNGNFLSEAIRKDLIGYGLMAGGVVTICICILSRFHAPVWRREKRSGREFLERAHHNLLGIGVEFPALLIIGLVWFVALKGTVK